MAKATLVLKRKLKSGEQGIYIRLLHLNEPAKYLKLPFTAFPDQWDKDLRRYKSSAINFSRLNKSLNEIEHEIDKIMSSLDRSSSFSYEAFRSIFLKDQKLGSKTINEAFDEKLVQLKLASRFGSFKTYSNCRTSLQKYTSLDIQFSDIDFQLLKGFELFHINLGNKPNSYGGYFRILRALHYEFCKLNDLPEPNIYRRFNIARIKNEARKKSLNREQLMKLIDYDPPSEAQVSAKQIFLFSFYARGINLMDMLQLTDKNLEGDVLVYRRQKTGKQMKIKLVDQALEILLYFQNESPYLFPYMREGDIAKYRISDINQNINRRLKLICYEIGIEHITMYYARHTFAELQYKAGIRIEIISQMLGHSDLKTTQTYLRSFSDDEVDDAAAKVFDSLK